MNGFILNAEIALGRSPEGHDEADFYGTCEDGRNFTWTQSPIYRKAFIPSHLSLSANQYAHKLPAPFTNQNKRSLTAYLFPSLAKLRDAQKSLSYSGFVDGDLEQLTQILIEKNIKGSVRFLSPPTHESDHHVSYVNPKVEPSQYLPTLKTVSIDIETGVPNGLLYAISLYNEDLRTVLLLDPKGEIPASSPSSPSPSDPDIDIDIESYPSEQALLKRFLALMHELNPHIIMGWNIMGFDFTFLYRKYEELGIPFTLGGNHTPVISYKQKNRETVVRIPGRVFLEGMDIVKALAPPLPNYKLDTAAEILLGEKKTISLTGMEKVNEINRLFETNKQELSVYNLKDSELVYTLMTNLDAVSFQLHRVKLTGLLMEHLRYPAKVTRQSLFPLMERKHVVIENTLTENTSFLADTSYEEIIPACKADAVGLISIKNLLAITVLTYKIDPYGFLTAKKEPPGEKSTTIHTPTGASFHPTQHFMPFLIERLLQIKNHLPPESTIARSAADLTLHQTIDGLTVTSSRFAGASLHKALHEAARYLVKQIAEALTEHGAEVLTYDAYHLLIRDRDPSLSLPQAKQKILSFLQTTEETIFPKIFGSIGHFPQLSLTQMFKSVFIPEQPYVALRDRSGLNYYGLSDNIGENLSENLGESLNKNLSKKLSENLNKNLRESLSKTNGYLRTSREHLTLKLLTQVETAIVSAYLLDKPLDQAIDQFKRELTAGDYNDLLTYRKKLTKSLQDTGKRETLPPHIQAALQIPSLVRDTNIESRRPYVYYIMTEDGGQPTQVRSQPPHYEHYWQKEITPFLKRLFAGTPIEKKIHDWTISNDQELSLF